MGIVRQVFEEMKLQGLSEEEARSRFYLVDQQGLLFEDTEGMTPQQKPYARKRSEFPAGAKLDNLEDVVKAIHPTILVGASTAAGAFTKEIVQEMAAHTLRPIIFPLSNPADLAEASADDLLHWTDGKAWWPRVPLPGKWCITGPFLKSARPTTPWCSRGWGWLWRPAGPGRFLPGCWQQRPMPLPIWWT